MRLQAWLSPAAGTLVLALNIACFIVAFSGRHNNSRSLLGLFFRRASPRHHRVSPLRFIQRARALRPVAFTPPKELTAHKDHLADDTDQYDRHLSLALVRTISDHDANSLLESFDGWDEFALGDDCSSGIYETDLIISFSRRFDDQLHPSVSQALKAIHSKHSITKGWGGCIRSVKAFEVNLSQDEDLYSPSLAEEGNPMWVNGPNRQFERTFRHVQSEGVYDVMFLMESDTLPVATGWLDNLVDEIKHSTPFALLGSKYDGEAWDEFADRIPLALLHHINGNGVYNVTHPLLDHIVSELEAEAVSYYNAIPYDYRISQMLLEGSSGIPPDFPYDNILDGDGRTVVLHPKRGKFALWWEQYAAGNEPVIESKVITNLGPLAYLPSDIESGVSLVHGKNMYLPWDPYLHGSIALVISNWAETDDYYKEFLFKLDSSNHPFSEIVVMTTFESDAMVADISAWARLTVEIPVVIQRRKDAVYMDLCRADVSTDYFMITDVHHMPIPHIELRFASDGSDRPVVPFIPSEGAHCPNFKACVETMAQARKLFIDMDRFVLSDEMLFNSHLRERFCEVWKRRQDEDRPTASNGGNILGPTATSYVAYLSELGIAGSVYSFSNAITQGSKRNFVLSGPKMPYPLKYNVAGVADITTQESDEVPLFWRIPRSAGTTMQVLLAYCMDLTLAASGGDVGDNGALDALRVVERGREKYVNVDLSTVDGIARAGRLDLVGSALVDVVVTPLLSDTAASLFSPETGRRAKVFAMFRHPVERAASLFYHLQRLAVEGAAVTSLPLQNMTLEEYATSDRAENNWMVRMLNSEPDAVDERHLEIAKAVVRDKIVVGLMSEMEESVERFYSYFHWKRKDEGKDWSSCERRLLFGGGSSLSSNDQKVEENSEAWALLATKNALDVALYEYIVDLFEDQGGKVFNSEPTSVEGKEIVLATDAPEDGLRMMVDLDLERRRRLYFPSCSSSSKGKGKGSSSKSSKGSSSKSSKGSSGKGGKGKEGSRWSASSGKGKSRPSSRSWSASSGKGKSRPSSRSRSASSGKGKSRPSSRSRSASSSKGKSRPSSRSGSESSSKGKSGQKKSIKKEELEWIERGKPRAGLNKGLHTAKKIRKKGSSSGGAKHRIQPRFSSKITGTKNMPPKLHKAKKRKEGKRLLQARTLEAEGETHMADDMLRPPRMYTFYYRVQTGADEDTDRALLHLWKKEWTRAGYEPHVLTLDHAKKHPGFESYQKMLQENTTLHAPLEYNYMCFFRWLAMAVVGGGYMSDNDVLPLQGTYLETGQIASFELPNGGEFTSYDRHVPSLLSGKAEEWDRLAMSILRIAIDQSSGIIPTGDGGKTSDMYALLRLVENKKDGGVRLSPVQVVGSPQDFTQFDEKACLQLSQTPAVHFSHAAISRMAGRGHINERPAIMEKWINRWRSSCFGLLRAKTLEAEGDTHMADDMLRPPRMYTFYHRVQTGADGDTDRALLHLWKKEWTRAGYEPHVLTLDHAKKHPGFESYQKMLQENTTLHAPLEYNYMCFFRWLAMAVVGGGYMSDNDVLPLQGTYLETGQIASFELPNGGEFTSYDRHVPSLLSGKAEEWDRLAMSILRIAIDQSSGIIPTGDGGKTSDMYALLRLVENKKDSGVRLSPVQVVGSPQDFTQFNKKACLQLSQTPAVHFSHAAISRMGVGHINERPAIMEKWINRWRSSCSSPKSGI